MKIVARCFTIDEFRTYVDGLVIAWPKFVVIHETTSPDMATFRKLNEEAIAGSRAWSAEIWLKNMASFYAGLGWSGTPHIFIPPVRDQIYVLNDLTIRGVHSGEWNKASIGIEVIGAFDTEYFVDPTKVNLVAALEVLHAKMGWHPDDFVLGERGIHFHNDHGFAGCPGRFLNKAQLVGDVVNAMGEDSNSVNTHMHVPQASQEANSSGLSLEEMTSARWLQERLNDKGLQVEVTGLMDSRTLEAVRTYQVAMGLTDDAIAGPKTRISLKG